MSSSRSSRLDERLVADGWYADRDQALRSIIAGDVRVDGVRATSPAQKVADDAEISVAATTRFVSRGGEKLAGALAAFHLDVAGLSCIDVGASTGGFTDCLLQAGAREVTCVDVGYGQLAWKLRQDPRVRVFERMNIRVADPAALGAPFDLIVADLSFIGLARLAPVFARLARGPDDAALDGRPSRFVGLVKPQFEAARDETDHGVVRDDAVRIRVVEEVSRALDAAGFAVEDACESPLVGPAGNHEFFVCARFTGNVRSRRRSTIR